MEMRRHFDECNLINYFNLAIDRQDMKHFQDEIFYRAIEIAAKNIANYILENHLNDILEQISPQAIANMSIAEAGAAVNETLHKKLPDKILEIERRTVYQRKLFGRLERIR